MVLLERDVVVIRSWLVSSLSEFLEEFDLEDEAIEYYMVSSLDDIYSSENYNDDNTEIEYWLEQDERTFMVHFVDDTFDGQQWYIDEVNVFPDLKKVEGD